MNKYLLEIEYSLDSKYFIGHKTFTDSRNLGEFNFAVINLQKLWSSICSIVFIL